MLNKSLPLYSQNLKIFCAMMKISNYLLYTPIPVRWGTIVSCRVVHLFIYSLQRPEAGVEARLARCYCAWCRGPTADHLGPWPRGGREVPGPNLHSCVCVQSSDNAPTINNKQSVWVTRPFLLSHICTNSTSLAFFYRLMFAINK